MNKLQRALLSLHREPMHDASVTWLSKHRPSVAFLLCIGSGPWVLQRRMQVQSKLLVALGNSDLCKLHAHSKLFPLAWQKQMLQRAKVLMRKSFPGKTFDEAFARSKRKRLANTEHLREIATSNKIPKVLWMFVRDFWKEPCFPVDRHVRRWCQTNDLPESSEELVELFNTASPSFKQRAPLQAWARVIFAEKSSNPNFPIQ